jgi:hypothetical protein
MTAQTTCKQCGSFSHGRKFCSTECRKAWSKKHNLTAKQWKRIHDGIVKGSGFDYEGNQVT